MSFSVTFTPGAEIPYGTVLVLNRGGNNASLTLAGRGIFRHMQIDTDAIVAPDTYRCPGDKAAMIPITVINSGEAPLAISNLDISGEPIWSTPEQLPVMVDGVPGCTYPCPTPGTRDIMISFSPQSLGKAPTGQLTVVSNAGAPDSPTKIIRLDGNGKERIVNMLPGLVAFPVTGANVPLKWSALTDSDHPLLSVTNDDAEAFAIREVRVDDGNNTIFEVVNLDGSEIKNVMVMPGETKQFDVIFKPEEVKEYQAVINLFMDSDCEPQRSNPVTGRAVFVDAHGSSLFGCVCQSGKGTGNGLIVLFAILFVRRRRRR
jgi:MYXO-CTERM domain-containing protein